MINTPQYIPQQQLPVMYTQGQAAGTPYGAYPVMQQPCCCDQQSQMSAIARYAQPRYSGVSIEIIEPQVKAPGANQNMTYSYPQGSVYNAVAQPPVSYPIPYLQQPCYNMQQPVQQTPVQPEIPTVIPPAPQPPQPVDPQANQQVIQTPSIVYNVPAETVPPAAVVTPDTTTEKAETATEATPAPVGQDTVNKTEIPAPVNALDLTTVVSDLNSEDIDKQAQTMENLSMTLENNPEKRAGFLDTNVVDALVKILDKDTTKLAGPTPRQQALRQKLMSGQTLNPDEDAEAKQLSPMEAGERNKQYSLYTLATMQNALSKELEKDGKQVVLNELPAIDKVITTAKENPNPMLRASALAGLAYIAKPEYKEILGTIFDLAAKGDEDQTVRDVAKEAIAKLNELGTEQNNKPAIAKEANQATPQQNVQVAA